MTTLTPDEVLTARTALLAACGMCDVAMTRYTGTQRAMLDNERWKYLKLAERLAKEPGQ